MSLNNFFLKNYKYSNILIYLFFLSFLIVGFLTYKSFGLSIDEPFHRTSGYFWFYTLAKKIFPFWDQLVDLKRSTKQMEWSEDFFEGRFHEYGPLFDLFSVKLTVANSSGSLFSVSFILPEIDPLNNFSFFVYAVSVEPEVASTFG